MIEQNLQENGQILDEDVISRISGTAFAAGADTVCMSFLALMNRIPNTALQTVSTLQTFILAMALFPDVRKKAQEEIDRVVGSDRLPEHQDRERLPYVNAVMREGLRSAIVFLHFEI